VISSGYSNIGRYQFKAAICKHIVAKKKRRKTMKKLMGVKKFVVLTFLFGFVTFSWAGEFPDRPIEILMPYGAVGGTAAIHRLIANNMSKYLGQQVILTPAIGAGGTVAGEKIAHRTKPDGYTLLSVSSGTNGVALFTKKGLTYTEDDFVYLLQTHASSLALAAAHNAPFKTLEEFIAYAKKNPHKIKHASTGIGTSGHFCFEFIKLRAGGLDIDLVPFRTAPEVTKAIVSGVTQSASLFGGSGGPNDEIQRSVIGGARLLAVTSPERLKPWPEVPTFREKGMDLVWGAWWGIGGPKGIPDKVLKVLKNALYKAVEDPEVKRVAISGGYLFEPRKQEEFTAHVREYNKIAAMVARDAKIPKN
jgi:tripartite-type tricarboxylate transporter receptor subunit TctC